MKNHSIFAFLFLSMLTTSIQADSSRGDDDKQRGNDKSHSSGHDDDRRDKVKKHKNRDHFIDQDRVMVHDFYSRHPSSLPPGLAKRGGNLPPGLAKRGADLPPGLSRGQVLRPDHHVHLLPLPNDLERLLPPPPHEVIRRILGRDIVLIQKSTNKVLDVLKDALP